MRIKTPTKLVKMKLDELFNLMDKNNIALITPTNTDTDFVIKIDDEYYAVRKSKTLPPQFDDTFIAGSDEYGTINEYDENNNLIEYNSWQKSIKNC